MEVWAWGLELGTRGGRMYPCEVEEESEVCRVRIQMDLPDSLEAAYNYPPSPSIQNYPSMLTPSLSSNL